MADAEEAQLLLHGGAQGRFQLAAADSEDAHGAEGADAGAAILQDEDARIVGERRDQPGVQLRDGAGHDDQTAMRRAHGATAA